ncbi:hypothetical protein B0G93_11214 [Bacillus sp. V-88]|nr:hypothetical protein B0G93_11214 [Bacillus sp. V-88]SLK23345.1 hypothetical protein SAMN06295884_11214 [Bacillus sp. V-88]
MIGSYLVVSSFLYKMESLDSRKTSLRAVLLSVEIPTLIKKFDLVSIFLKISFPQLIDKPIWHE